MSGAEHWDAAHRGRDEAALTWFSERPEPSVSLVLAFAGPGNAVIDVGGGASRLVDALLAEGFSDLTVLDLSDTALGMARTRLGDRAAGVCWLHEDVTVWRPGRRYDLWHDRAVFHFLTSPADRMAYVDAMSEAVAGGGHVVLSTFADDGPERCSGLEVARYAPEALAGEIEAIAPGVFRPVRAQRHAHVTPGGAMQRFQTSVFRKCD